MALDQGLRDASDLARLLPELQAIASFTRDLQQRFGTTGVDGISGVLGLHRLLAEALQNIPRADIERAQADVEALVDTLRRYAALLAELKALRDRLGV